MIRSIIVPLDGSALSEHALPYAIATARRTGATINLVRVHDGQPERDPADAIRADHLGTLVCSVLHAREAARRAELARLAGFADRLMNAGIPATPEILYGSAAEAIAQHAARTEDSMIVMTTHGRSGFRRLWLGSVADGVVQRSASPVLLVHPPSDGSPPKTLVAFDRLLVPVDGSSLAASVVEPVLCFAGGDLIELRFLQVRTPGCDAPSAFPARWPDGMTSASPVAHARSFDGLLHSLPPDLAYGTARTVPGAHAADAILEEARRGEYDAIALTTHGRGHALHLTLGSTADRVLRAADLPILLCRPAPMRVHHAEVMHHPEAALAIAG